MKTRSKFAMACLVWGLPTHAMAQDAAADLAGPDIIVRGEKLQRTSGDASAGATVIDGQEADRAMNADIDDALRIQPNVLSNEGSSLPSIRGIDSTTGARPGITVGSQPRTPIVVDDVATPAGDSSTIPEVRRRFGCGSGRAHHFQKVIWPRQETPTERGLLAVRRTGSQLSCGVSVLPLPIDRGHATRHRTDGPGFQGGQCTDRAAARYRPCTRHWDWNARPYAPCARPLRTAGSPFAQKCSVPRRPKRRGSLTSPRRGVPKNAAAKPDESPVWSTSSNAFSTNSSRS